VWFYQINNDGYDPDKITGGGRPETPERNDIPEMLRQWKAYKDSGFKKPPGTEAGALLPPGTEEAKCWWARISTIAENDYNLGAGRYKPQVADTAPEGDPAELISKTLKVEREIASGLEKLLKDVETAK
jgi:type I restriction enzyme M protein